VSAPQTPGSLDQEAAQKGCEIMKEYVRPIVLENEDLAEGVYAASGDCWSVSAKSVQEWNGSAHEFEVSAVHSTGLEHISGAFTVRLTFNDTLTDAASDGGSCSCSGNTVTVTRENHANAYGSGDRVTFKVRVVCANEAATRAVSCSSATCIDCDHQTNVQGGYD